MLAEQILPECSEYDRAVLSQIEEKMHVDGDCWIWDGQYHSETPVRSYKGRRASVRRIIYSLVRDQEYHQRLTTSCSTHGCLNPSHMIPWDGPNNEFTNRNRKLTPDQVAEILATPANLKGSGQRLAERFGVSPSLVSKIRRKKGKTHGRV